MISITHVTLQRGRENVLEDASAVIFQGRRIAVVGRNGCGKSSLFALLLGQISTEVGEATVPAQCRMAHMAQEVGHTERSALDYVLDGHSALRAVQARIVAAEAAEDYTQLSHLYADLETLGGYVAEHQAAELLQGLGFTEAELQQPVSAFSGGWRIRLNLAQALMMPSDLLLLDEPTNHLDLDTTVWLEQRLKRYSGTLLFISHDRDFIDQVADGILHIEHRQLHLYKGHYSSFERERAARLALQQANYAKQQQQIAHIQRFITRFKAKASKAKQAQSRVKQLANMELLASAQIDSPFSFRFIPNDKMSQPLISLQDVRLGYTPTAPILDQVHFSLMPGDRFGLLGVNGAGKSTLIKCLTGDLTVQAGQITQGEHCRIGYFAQHQLEALDVQASAALHIQRLAPEATESTIRRFLGSFDFRGDKAITPIAPFSGGEKARLALALIVWQKPNVLLLDEPTNHLDLDMRGALTLALQDFQGALVVVSHDRHLLRSCVDRFCLVEAGRVQDFPGTLADYHQRVQQRTTQKSPPALQGASKAQPALSKTKKQQRQHAATTRKAQATVTKQVQQVERKLEKLVTALQQVETLLADNALYQADQAARLAELTQQQAQLQKERDQLDEQWFILQEKLDT